MADAQPSFFAVIASSEGSELELKKFKALPDLASFLRTLPPSARGFAFHGVRLDVTTAPWRYLLCPDCPPVPLFDPPTVGRVDSSGGLGLCEETGGVDKDYLRLTKELLEEDAKKDLELDDGAAEEDDFSVEESADEEEDLPD